nr:transmembrane 9 superfamily member 7 [Ipomoea trifida]
MISIICIFFFLVSSAHSFYLPGVAPRDFPAGDLLSVKVNKLSSTKTQLPYDYYYLHYCKPSKILNSAENLGEVLRGDRIENSVFTFHMRQELPCQVACRVKLDNEAAKNFKEKIDDEYRVNMILDNLPVAVLRQRRDVTQPNTYEHGFRVGFKGNYAGSKVEKYFINNHLSFRVMYHKDPETDTARIVGFEVTPNSYKYVLWSDLLHTLASVDSINHEYKEWDEKNPQVTTCTQKTKDMIQGSTIPQEVDTDKEVIFTYDVSFKESDIKWASRWDTYLLMNDDQIHWFSIINSLMIVLFLSGMVAMIMMRTLYKDIANYNQLETQDEAQEETGWKLVHGDVFRPPINSGLLCVYVGTGVQIFAMTLVTMMFAVLGFLSPSNRGGLMTAMVLLRWRPGGGDNHVRSALAALRIDDGDDRWNGLLQVRFSISSIYADDVSGDHVFPEATAMAVRGIRWTIRSASRFGADGVAPRRVDGARLASRRAATALLLQATLPAFGTATTQG